MTPCELLTTSSDEATSICLSMTAAQAMRDLKQAEATRAAWENPLSIFAPDNLALAVSSFNASLLERRREMAATFEEIKDRIMLETGTACR